MKSNNTFIYSVSLLVTLLLLVNILSTHFIDIWIHDSLLGIILLNIYIGINSFPILGWFLLIITILIAKRFIQLIWKFKELSVCTPTVLLFFIFWIIWDSYWIYPNITLLGNFKWWLCTVLLICSTISLAKFFTSKCTQKVHSSIPPVVELKSNQNQFAIVIANFLQNQAISERAFAIGIEGEWGSGKSTVLNSIRQNLQGECIIDFNPWQSLSECGIIRDFFNSLKDAIKSHLNINIDDSLDEYADLLLQLGEKNNWVKVINNFFPRKTESHLIQLKSSISKQLAEQNKRLFIVIDDLDRVEGDELFEVLRLIRNTSDFPKIVYIASYDKRYITSQLQQKVATDGTLYLQKIFNLEMSLPKVQSKNLLEYTKKLIIQDIGTDGEGLPYDLIRNLLKTFRDAERFASSFCVTCGLLDSDIRPQIQLNDLFLVEVIRFFDFSLYTQLRNNNLDSLTVNKRESAIGRLVCKDRKQLNRINHYIISILEKLFPSQDRDSQIHPNSIAYVWNYRRYFSFCFEPDEVTQAEFDTWLTTDNATVAAELLANLRCKSNGQNSLLFQFGIKDLSALGYFSLVRYFETLFKLYFERTYPLKVVEEIIVFKLHSSTHEKISSDEFASFLDDIFSKYTEIWQILAVSDLLKDARNKSSLALKHIETLERENLLRYLSLYNPNTSETIDTSSNLHKIYKNSWKPLNEMVYNPINDTTEAIAGGISNLINEIIDYDTKHISLTKEAWIDAIFSYTFDDSDGNSYNVVYDPFEEDVQIISIFGSTSAYQNYVSSVFPD